ncbi:acyl-CoA dehydrogenase family protein [Acrocarpospora sp. B8E8]|uniref:acyl-CoA dehydrogenase family protein n=1 Tax=Acrocarpospora sp. B8E8 TaxID=3153572 RepID=UPI00325EE3F3
MSGEIADAIAAILRRFPQGSADGSWDETLGRAATDALRDGDWLDVGLPEQGDLADAVAVAAAVTAHGWPSPVPDLLLITNSALAAVGVPRSHRCPVVVPGLGRLDGAGRVTAAAEHVAWAPWADRLLVVARDPRGRPALVAVDPGQADLRPGHTLHGSPWAHVRLENAAAEYLGTATGLAEFVTTAGALARSAQSLAALERVRALSVEHVRTRVQFGRPLAAFQAVQQHLAALIGEVAAAEAAVAQALADVRDIRELAGDPRLATAKIRTSTAATEAARLAHQLHGAIGIAREHELHRHTLALLAWREEFGDERFWGGRLAASAGPDLWAWLTG